MPFFFVSPPLRRKGQAQVAKRHAQGFLGLRRKSSVARNLRRLLRNATTTAVRASATASRVCVCVCSSRQTAPFFPPVDSQHAPCPCSFLILYRDACSVVTIHSTATQRYCLPGTSVAVNGVDNSMPRHRAGYGRDNVRTPASQDTTVQ